jgi:hypothetical protein
MSDPELARELEAGFNAAVKRSKNPTLLSVTKTLFLDVIVQARPASEGASIGRRLASSVSHKWHWLRFLPPPMLVRSSGKAILLTCQQALKVLHHFGRSEIFLSLEAVGNHFSFSINEDQTGDGVAGIFFERRVVLIGFYEAQGRPWHVVLLHIVEHILFRAVSTHEDHVKFIEGGLLLLVPAY